MDEHHEYLLRRRAVRRVLAGQAPAEVLAKVQRSWAWLSKWLKRYQAHGLAGLKSQSRRPHRQPQAYSGRVRRLIVHVRQGLARRKVGLTGPRAIQRELRGLGCPVPARATIARILQEAGLTRPTSRPATAYCPAPREVLRGPLDALDWTCRYLEGGPKVYAFHLLALHSRMCQQTIATDKTTTTACAHVLAAWHRLGLPQFLQVDNDAAFCGGYKVARVFGQFVRLCLYLGVEVIFLPVAEPERNGEVERLNGLWGGAAFWERRRFQSVKHVQRASPAFIQWLEQEYEPPALHGLTPRQAHRQQPRPKLTWRQWRAVPDSLPITAGRVHFIRRVAADGTISLLNEVWPVGERWAGQYVWASIMTHQRRLEIYHQRAAQAPWRLLKAVRYELDEPVARLKPEFKRC